MIISKTRLRSFAWCCLFFTSCIVPSFSKLYRLKKPKMIQNLNLISNQSTVRQKTEPSSRVHTINELSQKKAAKLKSKVRGRNKFKNFFRTESSFWPILQEPGLYSVEDLSSDIYEFEQFARKIVFIPVPPDYRLFTGLFRCCYQGRIIGFLSKIQSKGYFRKQLVP
jgi:hypothetical protein